MRRHLSHCRIHGVETGLSTGSIYRLQALPDCSKTAVQPRINTPYHGQTYTNSQHAKNPCRASVFGAFPSPCKHIVFAPVMTGSNAKGTTQDRIRSGAPDTSSDNPPLVRISRRIKPGSHWMAKSAQWPLIGFPLRAFLSLPVPSLVGRAGSASGHTNLAKIVPKPWVNIRRNRENQQAQSGPFFG
jgi:hypothetical protein